MAKIGIYGGTFNPIHNGHINIITEFYRRLGFDRVLIIPTSIPPHKTAESLAENIPHRKTNIKNEKAFFI